MGGRGLVYVWLCVYRLKVVAQREREGLCVNNNYK